MTEFCKVGTLIGFVALLLTPLSASANTTPSQKLDRLEASCSFDKSLVQCTNEALEDLGETPETILVFLERECSAQNSRACAYLGSLYEYGLLLDKDIETAFGYYKAACDAGAGKACSAMGYQYATGRHIKRDLKLAEALTRRGCSLGHAGGCNQLALLFNIPKSEQLVLMEQGCEGGSYSACYNLAGRYARGDGVAKDAEKAQQYYAKSAALGGPSKNLVEN